MATAVDEILTATVADATADGRGIIRDTGKKIFVDGALAGERVRCRIRKRRRSYDEADLVEILQPSAERAAARCPAFGVCGGCALQHAAPAAQLRLKEAVLMDNLERIARVSPSRVLPAIAGSPWGYRRKARLAVKHVIRKGRVLVGFRERHKPYVTDTTECHTLDPLIGMRLDELAALVQSLDLRARIPQIEVAVGDQTAALVFRVLDPPGRRDRERLLAFSRDSGIGLYLQPGGMESIVALDQAAAPPAPLSYSLPDHDLEIHFEPGDFVQVNADVNRQMVARALELLSPAATDHILDLYCGLGNFSLPLARHAARVTGLEGESGMVDRAVANAARNGLRNAVFAAANLAEAGSLDQLAADKIHGVLLDPPRVGAAAIVEGIAALEPARILYVSCHPGTLARDTQRLCGEFGYRLEAAGVIDMFPQTAHVEAMALFTSS